MSKNKPDFSPEQFTKLKGAIERLGYTNEEFETLWYDARDDESYAFLAGILQVIRGEAGITTTLLRTIKTVSLPAVEKFSAQEAFREYSCNNGVRISTVGTVFEQQFLGRVEENVPAANLAVNQMIIWSYWERIERELGHFAEITLAHLFEMLKAQGDGQPGPLLTDRDGRTNLFLIRRADGKLGFTDVLWDAGERESWTRGWRVGCGSGGFPSGQNEGCLVISQAG